STRSFVSWSFNNSRQRVYCSALAWSTSSALFSQNRNQSTVPPWEANLWAGFVITWVPWESTIKSTGLLSRRRAAYGSHISSTPPGPGATTFNGVLTLSILNSGDLLNHCSSPAPNGGTPFNPSLPWTEASLLDVTAVMYCI